MAAGAVWAEATTPEGGSGALGALDREIAVLQQELSGLAVEEETQARELQILGTKEALSRRQAAKAAAHREALLKELADLDRRARELKIAEETSRVRARSVLREAYKQSAMAGYASLLAVSEPSDLLRGFQSLGVMARRQTEALARFESQRRTSELAAEQLLARRPVAEAAVAEASREQTRLSEDRAARLKYLDRIQQDRSLQQEAIGELARAADVFSKALQSFQDGGSVPRLTISFSRLKGALPWPADGSLTVPFGSVRHPRFGTVTPHPGIEISVPPGALVRAVGAGRVVFTRRYGSYGRTVVVDHGERYLSVYANLAASMVRESEDLLPGQQIGFAGEPDSAGKASFYFEIRHQGKAVDPSAWLRGSRRAQGDERRR